MLNSMPTYWTNGDLEATYRTFAAGLASLQQGVAPSASVAVRGSLPI
ncbi:MAG: hypothetical protein R3C14_29930 [Caldilineaceae bacterium]